MKNWGGQVSIGAGRLYIDVGEGLSKEKLGTGMKKGSLAGDKSLVIKILSAVPAG